MLKACIGLKQVEFIDRRHCSLSVVPEDVYRHERTLEELLLDFNGIQDLPPKFFRLTSLKKLTLCENDLNRIPPGVANFIRLVELDISKNAIEDIPTNMQFCRSLHVLDISSNPLLRTPESVSSISSLTHLYINDVAIPRLPNEIGNLENLLVLDARENTIKTLPLTIAKLKKLKRLDLGNNEIEVLPKEIGALKELTELWLDTNMIFELPESVTQLRNLSALDMSKNRLEALPANFCSLSRLSDLHLSENCLESLPNDFGKMRALTLLKLELNHLVSLPDSIGDLNLVTEVLLFDNMLDTIPASLFKMKSLEMLNLDRNHITEIPSTIGECTSLHVLSLRENELCELPEEIGFLHKLKVLDIVNNRIRAVPLSFENLNLDAFWIDGGQPLPLMMLEVQPDPDDPEVSKLSCNYLPQRGPYNSSMENFLEDGSISSDQPSTFVRSSSFGKGSRLGVAFDPSLGPAPEDSASKLVRFPTPFRKDLKALKAKRKKGKYKPEATPSTTIFRKGSSSKYDFANSFGEGGAGSLQGSQLDNSLIKEETTQEDSANEEANGVINSSPKGNKKLTEVEELTEYEQEPRRGSGLKNMTELENLSHDDLVAIGDDQAEEAEQNEDVTSEQLKYSEDSADPPNGSVVRTIEVTIEFEKGPGQTLGFSIAGGRGSTPAYEDVDDSIYITKIAPGGIAEQDGRLRLGDKLLSVNSMNMVDATHAESVASLKKVNDFCHLVVSREVLVVLPEGIFEKEEGEEEEEEVREEEEEQIKERTESPSFLPMPTARLTFSDTSGGDSDMGEGVAKKIVADVMDRSLKRVRSEDEVVEKETEGAASPTSGMQHDNYINFDIAQIVVKESRKEDDNKRITSPEDDSPLHSMKKPEEERVNYVSQHSRPSLSMSIEDEDETYPEERVVLDRSIGKLGLSIVGGADHVSRVFGQGRPGVYISKISKDGAAKATGKLRLGDRILEVNKFNVRFSTHQQAVQWLISQEGDIELLVQHVPQPHGLQEVELVREEHQKLGLSIRGGGKGSKGNPLDPTDEGIFISKIAKGGAAEASNKLSVGMRIVEVNSISLLGASHSMAVKALKSTNDLFITVCDGFDPNEVMRRQSLADCMDTTSSQVPLSAASSMVFSKAFHGSLSDSVDGLAPQKKSQRSQSAIIPPFFSIMDSKLCASSAAIDDQSITKEEDFDSLIEELARFKLETSQQIEVLDKKRRESSSASLSIPLSDIIGPLQNGGMGLLDDDAFEEDLNQEDFTSAAEASVSYKDTSSMLAELDSEMVTMHEEVSQGEDEMRRSTENLLLGDDDLTPKVRRRSTKHLKVKSPPAKASDASPETRRRAEQIRINLSPPPDAEASEAAVQSIIGEVFNDISFEEFETKPPIWSARSSGILSSYSDTERSMSPDGNLQNLLSALEGIGKAKDPDSKEASSESMDGPEPNFGDVPPPSERARTMPVLSSPPPVAPKVTLRVSTATKNIDNRKSAPPDLEEPENLTFKEKLALYKKATPNSSSELVSSSTVTTKPRSISSVTITANVPPPVNRRSSDEKPSSPTSPKDLPTTLSDRIAFLHSNQTKAGMQPVDVKKSAISARREEKRMERVLKTDSQMDSSPAPAINHTSNRDPSQNPTSENFNNSNAYDIKHSSTADSTNSSSPTPDYITQIFLNMSPVRDLPKEDGLSAEYEEQERGDSDSQRYEHNDNSSVLTTKPVVNSKVPTTLL